VNTPDIPTDVTRSSRYEYPFDPDRRNHTAATVFRLARTGGVRVLDLGSGPGIVAGALTALADKHVTCVDAEPDHLEAAAARGVARTVLGDLTDTDWVEQLAGERFDVIVLADVLEHLVDPGGLLRLLGERELLAPDGRLVISIPNASHLAMLALLSIGEFPYRPTGLLDETHLRFFTLTSIRHLLEAHGFELTRIERTEKTLEQTEFADLLRAVDEQTLRTFAAHDEALTYQFVLQAEPLGTARELAGLREEAATLRDQARQAERAKAELDALRERVSAQQAALAEVERQRDETRSERDLARKERDRLARKLDLVHDSATWRAGRVLTALPGRLKRLGRAG
jgi:2-polyprenyl-3-methyl-5-hydroxy-6-metoxy-1,4-benzoquinol methylase